VLSRATTILAALFMITSLSLSVLKPGRSSVLDQVPETVATPAPTEPAEEVVPPVAPVQQDDAADTGDGAPAEAPAEQ
jgi:hypothetical protein